ncbi:MULTISPECIES: hypothetical protein [unclassified Wolbachia]|uniref:hypothetical protein n=1 Tax=unclassified Wolbachia TaxID=2640676 RepID=UPI00142DFC2E|nr:MULTISPECIES: hypothetical protein [unclassified Wolbachia]QTP61507.1 hypothetical protein HUB92_00660 [Wolbachia endosymbiont of Wiebesia pumilae]
MVTKNISFCDKRHSDVFVVQHVSGIFSEKFPHNSFRFHNISCHSSEQIPILEGYQ